MPATMLTLHSFYTEWVSEFQQNVTVPSEIAPRSYMVQTCTEKDRSNQRHLIQMLQQQTF